MRLRNRLDQNLLAGCARVMTYSYWLSDQTKARPCLRRDSGCSNKRAAVTDAEGLIEISMSSIRQAAKRYSTESDVPCPLTPQSVACRACIHGYHSPGMEGRGSMRTCYPSRSGGSASGNTGSGSIRTRCPAGKFYNFIAILASWRLM